MALPSGRQASRAAATVAERFTTSRSPGAQVIGEVAEPVVDRVGGAGGHQQADVVPAPAAGGLRRRVRLELGRELEVEGGGGRRVALTLRSPERPGSGWTGPVRQQPQQPGDGDLWQRAVGDVLAREGVLVHLVRRSPGSTTYQCTSGSSAARTLVRCSRAALVAP